tara:strand:- start:485 stop:844 length:360 start_codon:yes stop_codon:yes gene_type:complete
VQRDKTSSVERNFRNILLPVVYAWILAATALVVYGLYKPEDVLPNLEGFLALLAILSAPATLAISEINRLYAAHQEAQIQYEPDRLRHLMEMEQRDQSHVNTMDSAERLHKIRIDDGEE